MGTFPDFSFDDPSDVCDWIPKTIKRINATHIEMISTMTTRAMTIVITSMNMLAPLGGTTSSMIEVVVVLV